MAQHSGAWTAHAPGYPIARDRTTGMLATPEAPATSGAWRAGPTWGAPAKVFHLRAQNAAEEVNRTLRIGVDGWLRRVWGSFLAFTDDQGVEASGIRLILSTRDDGFDALFNSSVDQQLWDAADAGSDDRGVGIGHRSTAAGFIPPNRFDIPLWVPVTANHRFGIAARTTTTLAEAWWEVELRA